MAMKRILPIIILLSSAITALFLQSCAGTNRLGRAQKVYDVGEYHRAISAFERAYKREDNRYYRSEISFYLGESYRMTNQPRRAAAAYGRAIRFGYPERKAKLYQAQQLQKIGNYEEALALYEAYLEEVAGDQLAHNGLAACRMALNPPPPTRYQVESIRRLNSRQSDFAPFIAPDDPSQIFFTSMRQAGSKRRQLNRITGQGASQIYSARQDSRGDWQDSELLLEPDPTANWEDGTLSVTSDGRDAFFTRCRYETTGPMGAEIWNVKRMGGRWGEAVKVNLGPDSLIFAHPAISPDGNTLYFVSDMPGGFGGKDLWMTTRSGDNWSIPINMGPDINTAGDEMFPYIRQDGTLYFSSNGHPGFGGLDIFRAVKLDEERWQVSNMGQPINSMADDFGITFHRGREAGFFSSSRDNSRGIDNIFTFALPVIQPVVTGNIDTGNNEPLPHNTTVRIVGTDGSNVRINVEPSGVFNALLEPDNEYVLLVASPGYFNHRERISTMGLSESRQYTLNIRLNSSRRPLVFDNIQFDAGTWQLTQAARNELDKVIAILNDNASVRINVTAHTDSRGDATQLIELAQKRAEAVMEYLTGRGIARERLSGRGAGGSQPLKVDAALASRYNYLREGEELNETFIQRLNRRDQETIRNLNNRVEFSIIP